ncbi:MAG: response regulator [Verrucomicrobiota bacterium]|nr:response regulator [Verrucomicrobiota bacterium]
MSHPRTQLQGEGFASSFAGASSGTLLIVDDDEGVRESLHIVFKNIYHILLAESGQKAIELAKSHPIDAAILDIRMPGMTGIELLARLKQIDQRIEVIMLTAYETIETAREALRLGACDYLSKPYEMSGIREAVANAMVRRAVSREIQGYDRKLVELQKEIHHQQLREELARTHSEIYASILHDINGPLTVIAGFIDLIQKEIVGAEKLGGKELENVKHYVGGISRQTINCMEISRRYLGFLQGKSQTDYTVPVNQVLSDLEELLTVHPAARRNQLVIYSAQQDIIAQINATDLLQILLNLTINALQSSPDAHRVQVQARMLPNVPDFDLMARNMHERCFKPDGVDISEPLLALTVQDNGPGMPGEILDLIFQPYFTTKPAGQGTGLGLSIVKRLITQAGGAIHLYSRPGEGTIFTVYLPIRL